MIQQTYFLTFMETAITRRWLRSDGQWVETNGFKPPATTPGMGKVYIFACAQTQWPIYVGQTKQSVGGRVGGAFKCTPDNRANGFAGYRFKRERTSAFLHVFLGDPSSPWTSQDAECIEAEVVFRIRRDSGAWPAFQSEIHFAPPTARHSAAADEIIAHFQQLSKEPLPLPLGRTELPSSICIAPAFGNGH
jgi:hypothetical protein